MIQQEVDMRFILQDCREENPEMVGTVFVRLSNFAIGRGMSAFSEVLAARGQFAEIGQAGQTVDKARLLGKRLFYRFKRESERPRQFHPFFEKQLEMPPQIQPQNCYAIKTRSSS
jgi:hypothetical protein